MSEEQLKELQEYNLEYLEAQQSEEIFGGDYTSAVELKYAKKEIERLTKQNKALNEMYELTKKEYIRLNNIINEIYMFLSQYTITHTWQKIVIEDTIKYIEELKGSGSNEQK